MEFITVPQSKRRSTSCLVTCYRISPGRQLLLLLPFQKQLSSAFTSLLRYRSLSFLAWIQEKPHIIWSLEQVLSFVSMHLAVRQRLGTNDWNSAHFSAWAPLLRLLGSPTLLGPRPVVSHREGRHTAVTFLSSFIKSSFLDIAWGSKSWSCAWGILQRVNRVKLIRDRAG